MASKVPKTISCDGEIFCLWAKPANARSSESVCRLRKIKCDKPRIRDDPPPESPAEPCGSCKEQKTPCTFNHVPQKPGPQPGSRKRKSEVMSPAGNGTPAIRFTPPSSHTTPKALDLPPMIDPTSLVPITTPRSLLGDRTRLGILPSNGAGPSVNNRDIHRRTASSESTDTELRDSTNPLEKHISRADLTQILDIYFEYIFCLVPFPHPPSFLSDLYNRREERPGEEEWTMMVLAMVPFTLVQVPHQMFPHSLDEIRRLVVVCRDEVKRYLSRGYVSSGVNRNFILYCAGLVEHNLGHNGSARELHGSNVSLVLQRELDREITYSRFSPYEKELQSRMWWLIYCADRSSATCEASKMMIDEDMCSGVQLPSDNPDILEDPIAFLSEQPSVLTGFRYISRAWRIAGQLISRRAKDLRNVPQGRDIHVRLAEVDELLEQLDGLMEGCPSFLRLELATEDSLSPLEAFLTLNNGLNSLAEDGPGNGAPVPQPKRQYIIQQANIYITQQCVRMMGLQYREQLQGLRFAERERSGPFMASLQAKRQREIAMYRDEQFTVLSYLLRILNSLPHELIAVNSLPGVTKIRYVAASLLAELEASPVNSDHDDGAHQRAVDYLGQYLTILAKIEALFSLTV
ncbi:hypothetical protein BD324DRAFT_651487 [Kockovaella imperatae]|uniref:Xylanolytic transcriptional activator regulatory domain-containing protein n=1 Tax=Kockovaella imperatae TaxID=4999 RepID=A0A1Y1UFE0_9TREE|nr:hypothetical protein BD324DRAFT_651487 [Kockovaella imperatae]ORX36247.1 hypothetical protein BD324DRAFT_651487 [Kockovaella imperatae]